MARTAALALATLFVAALAAPAVAQNAVEEWTAARMPAAPQLKPVKLATPKETALLVMDFTTQTCSKERRPRCASQVASVARFVNEARKQGTLIIHSVALPGQTAANIVTELTPGANERVLPPLGPDKFINSDLEKTLKGGGITTVVAMGTQAQTSVLHTGGSAALRGFKVIVPVDAMSADDVFPEAYTAWHLATAARIAAQTTLTKLDMISW